MLKINKTSVFCVPDGVPHVEEGDTFVDNGDGTYTVTHKSTDEEATYTTETTWNSETDTEVRRVETRIADNMETRETYENGVRVDYYGKTVVSGQNEKGELVETTYEVWGLDDDGPQTITEHNTTTDETIIRHLEGDTLVLTSTTTVETTENSKTYTTVVTDGQDKLVKTITENTVVTDDKKTTTVTTTGPNNEVISRSVTEGARDSSYITTIDEEFENGNVVKRTTKTLEGDITTKVTEESFVNGKATKVTTTVKNNNRTTTTIEEPLEDGKGKKVTRTVVENNESVQYVQTYDENGKLIKKYREYREYNPTTGVTTVKEYYDDRTETKYYKDGELIETDDPEQSLSAFSHSEEEKGEGTLASNLCFVSDSMEAIATKITSHNDLQHQPGSDSEAAIVGAMYDAANYYGSITNTLYGKLNDEASAVYSIANLIYQMDQAGAYISETELSDGMRGLYGTTGIQIESEIARLEAASQTLLESTKEALVAGGRFDSLTDILGTTISTDNAGIVSKTALNNAIGAIVPTLEDESTRATELFNTVDNFMSGIGEGSLLQGGVWDNVKKNMENYQDLLKINKNASQYLSDTLKTVMGLLVDYLGDDDEIDTTKYNELVTELERLESDLKTAGDKLTEANNCHDQSAVKNDDGEIVKPAIICAEIYNTSALQEVYDNAVALRDECKEKKEKIENLVPLLNTAQQMISDAVTDIKNAYGDPTKFMLGNENAEFHLDLSKYEGLDASKDYKKILDDYYAGLKAGEDPAQKPGEQDPAGKTPETEKETEKETSGDDPAGEDPPTSYGPPAQDPPTITTEAPSETTTEETTEEATEEKTEEKTEETTEETTVTPITEPITDIQTEPETVPQTEPSTSGGGKKPGKRGGSGGGSEKKPKNPGVETEPSFVETSEVPSEEIIIDDPIEEPVIEDYSEPIIEVPSEIIIEDEIVDPLPTPQKKGNGIKTMGIAAGIGLAVGASALGAHTIIKSKEEDDEEDSDYGYEK